MDYQLKYFVRKIPLYSLWAIFLISVGCAVPEPRPVTTQKLDAMHPAKKLQKEKKATPLGPPTFTEKLAPTAKGLIEDARLYSLIFEAAPLGSVISAITSDTDLNLSVEAEIDLSKPVTVNLKQVTFKEALEMVIVKGAGYTWRIEDGNLYVKRFEEKIYQMDYLDLVNETKIDIGGDMLGSGVEGSGVAGKYQVTGAREKKNTDVWTGIQEALDMLKSPDGRLRIDRTAGLIYMADLPGNVSSMVRFLDTLSEALNRQVFIEAKIMEVQLSDENSMGIDWTSLQTAFTSGSGIWPDFFEFTINNDGVIALAESSSVEGMLDFLRTQGDISVLSNPHLSLMNGQSAMMTVGYQFPFSDIEGVNRDDETNTTTIDASIKRAILGLQLGITVQISEDGIVALHIVPTITRIQREEQVEIPTTAARTSSFSNPVIDLQELSTMVRVREGQSIVLGGLISQQKTVNHEKLPWFSKIPLIGNFFNHMEDSIENRELVILITPYIKKTG